MNPNQKTRPENRREAFGVSQVELHTLESRILRYHRMLYSLAYRMLGNHRDAEDAVQSCVLSVRRNVRSFEHEGSFRA
jgi:DNA-directed RNA polymerase specialized sigma24 family protein